MLSVQQDLAASVAQDCVFNEFTALCPAESSVQIKDLCHAECAATAGSLSGQPRWSHAGEYRRNMFFATMLSVR